jgi:hypothetical protein
MIIVEDLLLPQHTSELVSPRCQLFRGNFGVACGGMLDALFDSMEFEFILKALEPTPTAANESQARAGN